MARAKKVSPGAPLGPPRDRDYDSIIAIIAAAAFAVLFLGLLAVTAWLLSALTALR
jgi:hypothetical protein